MNSREIESVLESSGLKLRGIVTLGDDEITRYGFGSYRAVVLAGNVGSSYWPFFSRSSEYADGEADPLDRWSRRIADAVAHEINAKAVFPFQGPPYLPFQQWAKRAESLEQSPIGLMIHPEFGLWHSYRFALLIKDAIEHNPPPPYSPCHDCMDQPCLHTCPVNAFSITGYDVGRCTQYLKQTASAECLRHGCMARFNCPVGRDYRYEDAQSRFHLQAFIHARTDIEN